MACPPEVNAFLCYIHKLKTFRFHTGNINNYIDLLKPQKFDDSSQELTQVLDVQFKNFKEFKKHDHNGDIYITDRSSDTKFDREQHKITLKIFLQDFEPSSIHEAVEGTLEELDTDFIEQVIVSFPYSEHKDEKWMGKVLETWKEVEKLVKEKMVMIIGVADFNKEEIEKLYDKAEILPRINQVKDAKISNSLKEFAETNGIQLLSHNDPSPFPIEKIFKEVCQNDPCLPSCGPCFKPRWSARYAIWAELWLVLESKGYIVKFDDCEMLSGSVP